MTDNDYIVAANKRRQRFAKTIGDGVLILTAAAPIDDTPYRPNPYLYYLAAFDEPQSALMLLAEGGIVRREILFCRPRNNEKEQWDGEIFGPLRARRLLHIKESADIADLPEVLKQTAKQTETAYYLPGADAALERRLINIIAERRRRASTTKLWRMLDASMPLDEMRLIKDATELKRMREAARLTCLGHNAAMRAALMQQKAKREYHLEAALVNEFKKGGGDHAFAPIVAAGVNACTLHYINNNAPVRANQLVLTDAGCRWQQYAADVSRTFAADGKFSPAQRAVYDIVLKAQLRAIQIAKPGARLDALENASLRVLCAGLKQLGLCRGNIKTIISQKTYRRFYPHRIGHFLGMDVHDVGMLTEADGKSRKLKKGMVLTIEPGLYIPDDADIPPHLRRIGIRIEDDILITARGNEVLTAAAPKTPATMKKLQLGD